MRWPWSKREGPSQTQVLLAEILPGSIHRGELLDACGSDSARARLCQSWAEQTRDSWFQGQRETIQDMIISHDRRYQHMNRKTRMAIGEMKWGKSGISKDIAAAEQMYLRWAALYTSLARMNAP